MRGWGGVGGAGNGREPLVVPQPRAPGGGAALSGWLRPRFWGTSGSDRQKESIAQVSAGSWRGDWMYPLVNSITSSFIHLLARFCTA